MRDQTKKFHHTPLSASFDQNTLRVARHARPCVTRHTEVCVSITLTPSVKPRRASPSVSARPDQESPTHASLCALRSEHRAHRAARQTLRGPTHRGARSSISLGQAATRESLRQNAVRPRKSITRLSMRPAIRTQSALRGTSDLAWRDTPRRASLPLSLPRSNRGARAPTSARGQTKKGRHTPLSAPFDQNTPRVARHARPGLTQHTKAHAYLSLPRLSCGARVPPSARGQTKKVRHQPLSASFDQNTERIARHARPCVARYTEAHA